VKQYIIVRDGQPIDTVDGNTSKYTDSLIICRKAYTYEVRAIAGITPSEIVASNQSTTSTTNNKKPKRTYVKYVTVSVPNNEVALAWDRSATFDVKWYYIYVRSAVNGRFKLIDSTNQLFYTHKRDTVDQPDCYFVTVVDNCGNESELSNRACIILLTGTQQPQEHHLHWTEYNLWQNGVNVYKVYKQEENFGWREIGSTSSLDYLDDEVSDTVNDHCYQVEAIENAGTHNATSSSTVFCLHQDPVVFVPNIFSPGITKEVNDKFGPKGLYMKSYEMQIYNRWGQLIYDTPDGTQWDGTVNGRLAPEGVYLYVITIDGFNKEGGKQRFKGTVTIIR
jgi:gliding motility-associated-like protein